MTKLRAPLTFELAIFRIVDLIGWGGAVAATGKGEWRLRKWSDPDCDAEIPLEVALKLDVAYRAAGGEGAPIRDCYALRLDAETAAICHNSDALLRITASAAKETGEAIAALTLASRSSATLADKALAVRETEEALTSLRNTLPHLGIGPDDGGYVEGDR